MPRSTVLCALVYIFLATRTAAARTPLTVDDASAISAPSPPSWPGRFSAQMLSNRSAHFGLDKLWYDWDFQPGVGRQVIRIVKEDGSIIYDVMPGDGNAYYIDPHAETCKAIKFGVSILTPDWQLGGEYLGRWQVDGQACFSWRKGFGIQCTCTATHQPLLITFDRKESPTWTQKFLTYDLGEPAPEELYRIPPFCPEPTPLPPAQMAEARKMLRSFKSHTPHILLDESSDVTRGATGETKDREHEGLSLERGAYSGGCPHLRALYETAMGRGGSVE